MKKVLPSFTSVDNVWELYTDSPEEAERLRVRGDIMLALRDMIHEEGLTQVEAAARLGVTQPRVSALVRGKVSEFSLDQLMVFLMKMGWKFQFSYEDEQLTVHTEEAA